MKLFNWFKKQPKKKMEQSELERIGAVVVMELHSSRTLRRKIKGTRMESMILQILNEDK